MNAFAGMAETILNEPITNEFFSDALKLLDVNRIMGKLAIDRQNCQSFGFFQRLDLSYTFIIDIMQ